MNRGTVLVTGAGAGIGLETVKLLLADGWRVGAVDLNTSALETLGAGEELYIATLNVTDPDGWARVLEEFCGDGPLDVLVNNAGILQHGAFAEIPLVKQLTTIDVNVKGVLIGCHRAYPYLKRSSRARVVNLASAAAIYGQAALATYSASKFAVRGLTEALDLEWSGQGISVQAIWPLFAKTAMTEGMDTGTTRSLGIRLTPQQVAKVVVKAITTTPHRYASVHRPAGRQAQALLWASAFGPSFVNRLTNKRLADG